MASTPQLITAAELEKMPPDECRRELVRGEIVEMPLAGHEHGRVAMQLGWRMAHHVDKHRLGRVYAAETGFWLESDPDTVRAPDVAFVRRDRLGLAVRKQGFFPAAPDLAVEVLSPSEYPRSMEGKVEDYLRAGCRAVWVIDTRRRTATLHRPGRSPQVLGESGILECEDLIPGFRCLLAEVLE